MEKQQLSYNLDENIAYFKQLFKNDNTFVLREIISLNNMRFAILFLDGMVNSQIVNDSLIRPLKDYNYNYKDASNISKRILDINEVKCEKELCTILNALLYGDSIIIIDKENIVITANTKGFATRSVAEPDNEKIIRGPREGFTEAFMSNLSLIRRKIKNENLKFNFLSLGTQTKTTAAICYMDNLVDRAILKKLKYKLSKFKLDSALDTNYIMENIRDNKYSVFETVGVTERPDIVAAKILEGRVALILDGTPVVITVPYIFLENFQENDDYYLSYLYTNINRLLRIFAFCASISLPSLYVAVLLYHREIIPNNLLLSIMSAREGVPMPLVIEAIALLIVFEILKEAGTRTPSNIGQTLSIVGGLVLGQSAVEAKFVSAPIVIIIAFSGITALAAPKLKAASVHIRLFLLILASILGLYGYIIGISLVFTYLASIKSFGVDYLRDITDEGSKEDVFLRFPWFIMAKDKRFLAKRND